MRDLSPWDAPEVWASTIARISGETAAPSMKKTLLAYGLKRGRRTVPLNAAVAAAWKAGPMLRRGMGTYGRAKINTIATVSRHNELNDRKCCNVWADILS